MTQRLVSLFLVAVATAFLAGCGARPPAATAQAFLEALAKGNLAEAKKHATEQTGSFLDLAGNMAGGIPKKPDFKFVLVSEKIDGDAAKVVFKDGSNNEEDDIDLIKVSGAWKVHIKKD
jgi:hypothetical protein